MNTSDDNSSLVTPSLMKSTSGRGSLASRYLAAFLAPAVVAGLMQLTWPFFSESPVSPYLLAVVFCSWYGGFGAGMLSLLISFLIADFFFIEPYFHFWFPSPHYLVRLLIFALVGPFICIMSELMHRERRRALANLNAARRAEESLKQSEQHLRRVINNLFAFVGVLLPDGTLIEANLSPLQAAGISFADVEGKKFWDCYWWNYDPAIQARLRHACERAASGEVSRFDIPVRLAGGVLSPIDFMLAPMYDDSGKITHLIPSAIEIADRKQAEEALRTKNEELAAMTQQLWQASKLATMGELAASIAHELNNPLAIVALRTEKLLLQLPAAADERRPLEIITQEVDRMATLVNNLLQFSRRSSRQISTTDVREEITNSLEFVHYHLRNRNIEVVRDFAEPLPTIQADRQQLRQLFLNVLTNASDAMPEGGKISVLATANGSQGAAVTIDFADSGTGISAEHLGNIWDPFFTTKPEGKGTGLGLAICRRIVEEHGGTISIQSEIGSGTTVRVIFPTTTQSNGGSKQ